MTEVSRNNYSLGHTSHRGLVLNQFVQIRFTEIANILLFFCYDMKQYLVI